MAFQVEPGRANKLSLGARLGLWLGLWLGLGARAMARARARARVMARMEDMSIGVKGAYNLGLADLELLVGWMEEKNSCN